MSNIINIHVLTPKKLRTLRNNLNNRISSFENPRGTAAKELQKSHVLFGRDKTECQLILEKVQSRIKELAQ